MKKQYFSTLVAETALILFLGLVFANCAGSHAAANNSLEDIFQPTEFIILKCEDVCSKADSFTTNDRIYVNGDVDLAIITITTEIGSADIKLNDADPIEQKIFNGKKIRVTPFRIYRIDAMRLPFGEEMTAKLKILPRKHREWITVGKITIIRSKH